MARANGWLMHKFQERSFSFIMEDTREITTIGAVSDESLQHIFLFLPLIDRIKIERVCQRWKRVSELCWSKSCSVLELPHEKITTYEIRKILKYCGKYISCINFSMNAGILTEKVLIDVVKYCKNVQSMDLTSMKISQVGIKILKENFKNITDFSIGCCANDCDKELSLLFTTNEKMKSLTLESISSNCTFLKDLPISDRLERLVLEDIDSDFIDLCKAADKYKSLHTLCIRDCYNVNDHVLKTTTSKWRNLKTLQFRGYFPKINSINDISTLMDLESLDVSCNSLVNDIFVEEIVKGCKLLSSVNISYCNYVTKNGVEMITSLPKLKYLYINHLNIIKEFKFLKMPHLEIFECRGCSYLRNENLSTVFLGSPNIKLIDTSYCKLISNYLLDIAELLTEHRTNRCILEINVYGTNVEFDRAKKFPFVRFVKQQEYNKDVSIHTLNDDCLRQIFLNLPLKDRLKLSKVCKRWHGINEALWNNFKSLGPAEVKEKVVDLNVIYEVLYRCKFILLHIDFSIFGKLLNKGHIENIANLCTKLKSIDISYYTLTLIDSAALVKLRKIESISIGLTDVDKVLDHIFGVMKNLKYVKIANPMFHDRLLNKLPKVETLILTNCKAIHTEEFCQAIGRLKSLKNLSITKSTDLNSNSIALHSPTLKTLRLLNNVPNIDIYKMPQLRRLDISNNPRVDDTFLEQISLNCMQLSKLDISNCNRITDDGLSKIIKLPHLEHLSMNYLDRVTDQFLNKMHNLRILECRNCINLYNAGLFELIDTSPNLEVLDLTNCKYITHHLVAYAINAVNTRRTCAILKMYVGGTSVQTTEVTEGTPYLRLFNLENSYKKAELIEYQYYLKSAEELFEAD